MINRRELLAAATLAALAPFGVAFAQDAKPSLRIALSSAPTSLDPSRGSGGSNATFQYPAYAGLLYIAGDGVTITPLLAESFGWASDDNTEFKLVLREGLMFSDGTPLDAVAVKASVEHYAKGGSVFSFVAAPIAEMVTPDNRTVVFKLSQPTPSFPADLAGDNGMGLIISPTAFGADPEALGTSTVGAGPYMLSKDGTVEGSTYRYVPNPHYHDAASIAWAEIVLRVIQDPNTALSTLQAGDIDVSFGTPMNYTQATGAGVEVAIIASGVNGFWIQDHDGRVVKALANPDVRRAISLAIDRKGLAQGLTFGTGQATAQAPLKGTLGYDPTLEDLVSYDPDKARELLKAAGLEGGFTIPVIVPAFIPPTNLLSQAVASQLAEVGITLEITAAATFPEYAKAQESGSFAGTFVNLGMNQGMLSAMSMFFNPHGLLNPAHEELKAVLDPAAKASALSGDAAQKAWAEINRTVVADALTLPVVTDPSITYYEADRVTGVDRSAALNPVLIVPAK